MRRIAEPRTCFWTFYSGNVWFHDLHDTVFINSNSQYIAGYADPEGRLVEGKKIDVIARFPTTLL